MKRIFVIKLILYFVLFISVLSCNNSNTGGEYNINNTNSAEGEVDSSMLPTIDFDAQEFNFGTVIQGEKVAHSFAFTNNGKSNLVISNVKASCGCTVPKWSKEPIKPGEKGYIELVFDSSNREGIQTKSVNVYSNTQPNVHDLYIKCEIIK